MSNEHRLTSAHHGAARIVIALRIATRLAVAATAAFATAMAAGLTLAAGPALAQAAPCFDQLPGLAGIPPWGFHTSAPLVGPGSYARAYGNIDLATGSISGLICQATVASGGAERIITMRPISPILYHSHVAELWGYPGNLIRTTIRVVTSDDPRCRVGTYGKMIMFASYNGVRSDSIQFGFPRACRAEDRLYHGPEVNAQVPPL